LGKKRIIIGISGASGAVFGIRLLEYFHKNPEFETHLTWGTEAKKILSLETRYDSERIEDLADYSYDADCLTAPVASGSFITDGMVVIPCSMRTLGAVANAVPYNLLTRAADVCLKEKRKLVLVVRESPLHPGYIKNMYKASVNGAIILPPVMAFYNHPEGLDDIINYTTGKILDLFGIEHNICKRWGDGS
jgi:4-hydroxy-3-polyprenylbenzoate decarboxylase